MISSLLASLMLAGLAASQQPAWAQCGGQGYTGPKTCVSGWTCVFVNDWYSQCQVAATTLATSTKAGPSSTSTSTSTAPGPTGTGSVGSVRYLGRVNPATKELTWPGTGISFTFTGSSFSIGISAIKGANSAELTIDGKSTVISNVAGTSIKNPSTLSRGVHTVVLRKRSETELGTFSLGSVTTDGTFGVDVAPKRKIEIIGDSITVGYGLDGVNPCSNNAAVTNNPKTYGALAAAALGADYSVVAWSGKGIVRNYASDGQPLIPQLYTRYGANDADNSYPFPSSWIPDAITINLGTNDFGYLNAREKLDVSLYTSAMVKFVRSLQTRYPNAHIFLLTSPMLSDYYPTAADAQHTTQSNALKSVISQVGAAKTHLVDWPTQGSDVGCDYHPNAATNAAEAKVLEAAIRSALGW